MILISSLPFLIVYSLAENITGVKNITMNYSNYATAIQEKHHVQLLGWPPSVTFQNPSRISAVADATLLRNSLAAGTCA